MTKKTRLLILIFCILCFFMIAPILVAYSEGYRFDFEKMEVKETGGIYVRTFPTADQIAIDSGASTKPGLFANYIFVQSLLPKIHTVSIKKTGYYDYFKNLPVKQKEVTKLENVLLIKKNIIFKDLASQVDYFSLTPNNQNVFTAVTSAKSTTFNYFSLNTPSLKKSFTIAIAGQVTDVKWSGDQSRALVKIESSDENIYYLFDTTLPVPADIQKPTATRLSYLDKNSQQISFSPQDAQTIFYLKNNTLYSSKGNNSLPVIKNVASFKISGTDITWLSLTGTLSNSDLTGKLITKINVKNFTIVAGETYEIVSISGNTFLKASNSLFKLNPDTKTFESFIAPNTDFKILPSGDNKNIIYWNSDKIYLYSFLEKKLTEIFSGNQIANLQWLNNDYIIFNNADKIAISEIDYRGNVNTVTLTQTIDAKNPSMFYDTQNSKIFILANKTLSSSEKITP